MLHHVLPLYSTFISVTVTGCHPISKISHIDQTLNPEYKRTRGFRNTYASLGYSVKILKMLKVILVLSLLIGVQTEKSENNAGGNGMNNKGNNADGNGKNNEENNAGGNGKNNEGNNAGGNGKNNEENNAEDDDEGKLY